MGWSKETGHDIYNMNDDLMDDLKQNAVPADLFNKVTYFFVGKNICVEEKCDTVFYKSQVLVYKIWPPK